MAEKLRFGVGGLPLTTKSGGTLGGIARLRELGLEHLELEFVQSVFIKREQAAAVKEKAQAEDVTLSVHGSYYVNLASDEKPKWHASISRVVQAAEIGYLCGARSITYHSGFKQKKAEEVIYELIKSGTLEILKELEDKEAPVRISPELTGKPAQFGSVEELVKLIKGIRDLRQAQGGSEDVIGMCIDFAHNYARSQGKYNTYDEIMQMLDFIVSELGEEFIHDLHIHMSAIEFGPAGEKNHLLYLPTLAEYKAAGVEVDGIESHFSKMPAKRLEANKFNWQGVLQALKKAGVRGYVVCESPILELDALLMQKYYGSL